MRVNHSTCGKTIEKWLIAEEIAPLLSITVRSVRRRATKENWITKTRPYNGGQQKLYSLDSLPEDIQRAYAASIKTTLEDLQNQLKPASKQNKKATIARYSGRGAKTGLVKEMEKTPEYYLHIAALRLNVLDAYSASGLSARHFVTAYKNGVVVPEVKEKLGGHGNINYQSGLYRWLERYEAHGIAGLAPQYPIERGGSGATLDERAKDLIQALYLNINKPSVRTVTRDLKQFGYELNYSIVNRYVNNEIPESVKTYYRKGEKAYHDKFDPYIERDYTLFNAMDWGVADHKTLDFIARIGERKYRLYLTMCMDMRSRRITGWHIDVTPNTLTILRTLSMSVRLYGTFKEWLVDNGKDFKSYWLAGDEWKAQRTSVDQDALNLCAGVLKELGSTIHFCQPYHGQSKPIERAFGTVIELFEKRMETYVGSNTVARPEETKLYWGNFQGKEKLPLECFPTLEQVREKFGEFVEWFNAEWQHSGQGMDGKTPNQVFEETLQEKREVPERMRKFIFTRREIRTVQRNGVEMDKIEYCNRDGRFAQYIGQLVEVRRDIDDAGRVYIFDAVKKVHLFDAESDLLKDRGVTEENMKVVKREAKARRKHLKEYGQLREKIKKDLKSPADLYAEKKRAEVSELAVEALQVVGGDPLPAKAQGPALFVHEKPKRKLKGIFDD